MGSDAQLIVRICRAVRTGIEWNFSECENALIFGESDYSRAARPTRPDLRGLNKRRKKLRKYGVTRKAGRERAINPGRSVASAHMPRLSQDTVLIAIAKQGEQTRI